MWLHTDFSILCILSHYETRNVSIGHGCPHFHVCQNMEGQTSKFWYIKGKYTKHTCFISIACFGFIHTQHEGNIGCNKNLTPSFSIFWWIERWNIYSLPFANGFISARVIVCKSSSNQVAANSLNMRGL